MKTGWHIMSDTEYFGRNTDMNASGLVKIYKWMRFLPFDSQTITKSPALLTGTAFHLLALQPEIFAKSIGEFKGNLSTKEGKAEMKSLLEMQKTNPGMSIVYKKDLDLARSMAEAVKNSSEAQDILRGCVFEQAGFRKLKFDTYERNPPEFAKIKIDARKKGILVDLKSTTAKSRDDIQQAVEDYHYDMKAAYYFDVANPIEELNKTGITYDRFIWIFVTKDTHECVCYEASDEDLAIGRQKYLLAYEILLNYYNLGIIDTVLDCPAWKYKNYKAKGMI